MSKHHSHAWTAVNRTSGAVEVCLSCGAERETWETLQAVIADLRAELIAEQASK
jgi:hypothetical protein